MGAVEIALAMIMGGNGGGGGGGSSATIKDVNFFDYDGTLVDSYTAEEFAALSALPANPSHEGLTAQGWNWSLSDAKTYVASYGKLDIGQMYITKSGDTELDIELHAPRLTPYLGIAVNGTVEVDWGDETSKDTVTGEDISTQIRTPHNYSADGKYTIRIHVVSGSFTLYGNDTYPILNGGSSSANNNRVYSNSVKAVRIGSGVTSLGNGAFNYCYSLASVTIPSGVTSIDSSAFSSCGGLGAIRFNSSTQPTVSNSNAWTGVPSDCTIYVPFSALAAYLSASNYPAKATYTYMGFATYNSGETLPTQDSTEAYNVTWYASKADALAQTNPITEGNGNEIYCQYAAV